MIVKEMGRVLNNIIVLADGYLTGRKRPGQENTPPKL